jgi:homoserine O-acetyltransferase
MAKANQLYNVENEVGNIKAKILFVPASSDLVFPPEFSRKAADKFSAQGGTAEVFVLEGDRGHLDGVVGIAKAADAIRSFMNK